MDSVSAKTSLAIARDVTSAAVRDRWFRIISIGRMSILLRQFVPERGKIMPRRISGISAKDQRRVATGDQTCKLDGNAAVCCGLTNQLSVVRLSSWS